MRISYRVVYSAPECGCPKKNSCSIGSVSRTVWPKCHPDSCPGHVTTVTKRCIPATSDFLEAGVPVSSWTVRLVPDDIAIRDQFIPIQHGDCAVAPADVTSPARTGDVLIGSLCKFKQRPAFLPGQIAVDIDGSDKEIGQRAVLCPFRCETRKIDHAVCREEQPSGIGVQVDLPEGMPPPILPAP